MPKKVTRKSRSSMKGGLRKGTRSARRVKGIASRVYAPLGHALNATGETVGTLGNTVGNIASCTIKGASEIGRIWTRHLNSAMAGK
jgi:hypothetical protein